MEKAFRDVIEFHRAYGDELPTGGPLAAVTDRLYKLRRNLIDEEYDELCDAMFDHDLPEIADGIADLIYVLLGTAFAYGIDIVPIWRAIHRANMAKFGPGSWRDETGKQRKPEDWVHPDIAEILASQKPLAETYGEPADG